MLFRSHLPNHIENVTILWQANITKTQKELIKDKSTVQKKHDESNGNKVKYYIPKNDISYNNLIIPKGPSKLTEVHEATTKQIMIDLFGDKYKNEDTEKFKSCMYKYIDLQSGFRVKTKGKHYLYKRFIIDENYPQYKTQSKTKRQLSLIKKYSKFSSGLKLPLSP